MPIPKIEVSIYQSPESKKKEDGRDYQEYPDQRESILSAGKQIIDKVWVWENKILILIPVDITSNGDISFKTQDTEISHTRRASEKIKKRMKMADLKAFVETKLLSKSEKALEKIGQEESKESYEEVCESLSRNIF